MTNPTPLHHDQTLFLDIDIFDPKYLSLDLAHRDARTRELAFLIDPARRGGKPETPSSAAPQEPGR